VKGSRRVAAVLGLVIALLLGAGIAGIAFRSGSEPDGSTATGAAAAAGSADAGAEGARGGSATAPGPRLDPVAEVPVPGGTSGLPGRRSASAQEVARRTWPARVAATGPWSSTLGGLGDRIEVTAPGTILGGINGASVTFQTTDPRKETPPRNQLLLLPDGARWYPLGRIRLEGLGPVAFAALTADGSRLAVRAPSFEVIAEAAKGGAVGRGTFVQPDGREVDRLAFPVGTRVVTPCQAQPGQPPCSPEAPPALSLEVVAGRGLSLRAAGDGEAAVAGSARATALGRTWEGLVAAIEARELEVAATYDVDRWTLTAVGAGARQVWVDVWPVIDTVLKASSDRRSPGFFDALRGDTYAVGIQWTNVGFATSQIFEAEGVGPGAGSVGFDLNKTLGHDAGLNVTRGDRVVNMRGGGDIDSNLAPGQSVSRGLSVGAGATPTIILRGNFPEVRVTLAVRSG
jgi:hypothetical protein